MLNKANARARANEASRGRMKDLGDLLTNLVNDGSETAVLNGSGLEGTGTIIKSGVRPVGNITTTSLLLDLTGLDSDAALGDIIGVSGTANPCYLTQVQAVLNGTIFGGKVKCLEVPAGGEVDIDFYAATEGTGVTDGAIGDLTETQIIDAAADWTLGLERIFAAMPAADSYLYATVGTASTPTAGTYTAGKFLLEMWGYAA